MVSFRPGSNGVSKLAPRADVTVYSLVHRILEAERARDTEERRAGRRHAYRCTQWVAAVAENPSGDLKFRPVFCVELSATGLLYLANTAPHGEELIVELGSERPIRLRAGVVRIEQTIQFGRLVHRVACRFTDRAA